MPNAARPAARAVSRHGYSVSRLVSDETLSRGIQIESAGRPHAQAATSSAAGLAQFVSATWLATVHRHRPDWLAGRTPPQVLDLRLDPRCAIEMMARFWEDNAAVIGPGWTDGDLYLAHFAGAGTVRRLLREHPSTPCSRVFSAAAIAANRSILSGKACGEVRAWAERRMAQSGGRNWIAVHVSGARPVTPPAAQRIAAGSAAGATVTVAAGVQQGWHLPQWLIGAGLVVLVTGIAGAIWWTRSRRRLNTIEQSEDGDGLE